MDFLKQAKSKGAGDHLHIMQEREYVCNIAFLADIFSLFDALNIQLHGSAVHGGYGVKDGCLWEQT